MGQLFAIRTIDELNHLLSQQRSMSRQMTLELDDIVRGVWTPANQDDEEYLAQTTMRRERELLRKYAVLPTLTEHERSPALRGAMQPGATFAVAAIVGEVILAHVRTNSDVFPRAHRMLLMVMLHEFDKPVSEDGDLVDTFVRSMRVDLTEEMQSLSPEERRRLLHAMLQPLAEAMIVVGEQFGLIEDVSEQGWVLTDMGQRVMLHLFDAQRFLESVADAHRRFQNRPKQ